MMRRRAAVLPCRGMPWRARDGKIGVGAALPYGFRDRDVSPTVETGMSLPQHSISSPPHILSLERVEKPRGIDKGSGTGRIGDGHRQTPHLTQ